MNTNNEETLIAEQAEITDKSKKRKIQNNKIIYEPELNKKIEYIKDLAKQHSGSSICLLTSHIGSYKKIFYEFSNINICYFSTSINTNYEIVIYENILSLECIKKINLTSSMALIFVKSPTLVNAYDGALAVEVNNYNFYYKKIFEESKLVFYKKKYFSDEKEIADEEFKERWIKTININMPCNCSKCKKEVGNGIGLADSKGLDYADIFNTCENLEAEGKNVKYTTEDNFETSSSSLFGDIEDKNCKREELIKHLEYLIDNNIFDYENFRSYLPKEIKVAEELMCKSDKLKKLDRLFKFLKAERLFILSKNEKVSKILMNIYKQAVENRSGYFTTFNRFKNNKFQNVIYFEFENVNYEGNKYLILSEANKSIYSNMISCEKILIAKYSENKEIKDIKIDSVSSKRPIQAFTTESTSYKEMISENSELTESNLLENDILDYSKTRQNITNSHPKGLCFEIDNRLDNEKMSVLKNLNTIRNLHISSKVRLFLKNNCNVVRSISTIYNVVRAPIRIRNALKFKSVNNFEFSRLQLGNVSSFFCFSNIKNVVLSGSVSFSENAMVFFYNNENFSYKFIIQKTDLDEYFFLHVKNSELNCTILLKYLPRVLKANLGSDDWKRVSTLDVPYFKDRFDIRFTVDSFSFEYLLGYFYNLNIIYGELVENNKLNISEIRDVCDNLNSAETYYLECFLTQKGRFIGSSLSLSDIKNLRGLNFVEVVKQLDFHVKRRFQNVPVILSDIAKRVKTMPSADTQNYTNMIKSCTFTPLQVVYEYPSYTDLNRILREFDIRKFIRISFRDEDFKEHIIRRNDYDAADVYDYFRSILADGFFIGKKKFFFLAMSSSQLRLHNAWFMTPYVKGSVLIGPDHIRSWIGDFSAINNIGKYAVRLGLALSSTTKTIHVPNYKEEPDIISNGYVFTDGIGMINHNLAIQISHMLELSHIPSAFQIRFGGYKGVVSAFDIKEELILRESMRKFSSKYNFIEVISFAQRKQCYLNRQIIFILESLGIPKSTFITLHDQYILRCIKKGIPLQFSNFNDKFTQSTAQKNVICDIKSKARIFVGKGRIMMGVLDELGVLEEGEVFIMSKVYEDEDIIDEQVAVVDDYLVVESNVIVAKNPCLHPGDVRVVKAVNRKELHFMKECLVFSKKGPRPIFNMCSGSDLDGDIYLVSWDKRIIPNYTVDSGDYTSSLSLYKEIVTLTDIVNFYIKYMKDDQIGMISNAHLIFSDKNDEGVRSSEAMRLAYLFNMGIDFPKTGYVATLPYDLVPKHLPDYMEGTIGERYISDKSVGKIYRRASYLTFFNTDFCNCQTCNIRGNFLIKTENKIKYPDFDPREGQEMYKKFERDDEQDIIAKYRKIFFGKQGDIGLRALSWHKAGENKAHHSYFQYLVEDFIDLAKYGDYTKRQFHSQLPFKQFIFHERVIIIDVKYKNDVLDENCLRIYKDLTSIDDEGTRRGTENSRSSSTFVSKTHLVVFIKEDEYMKFIDTVRTDMIDVFREIFQILVAFKFLDLCYFSCVLDFYNFLVKNINGNCSRMNVIQALIKISSDFFFESNFNLEDKILNFLFYGDPNFHAEEISKNEKDFDLSVSSNNQRNQFQAVYGSKPSVISIKSTENRDLGRNSRNKTVYNELSPEYMKEHRSNSLLSAALLLSTPILLKYKLRIATRLSHLNIFKMENNDLLRNNKVKPGKNNETVVLGMFDEYDEVYFSPYKGEIEEKHAVFPCNSINLMNYGKTTIRNYKDNLRQFIVSHILNRDFQFKVRIIFGNIYFFNLENKHKNNTISIRDLADIINFKTFGEATTYFKVNNGILQNLLEEFKEFKKLKNKNFPENGKGEEGEVEDDDENFHKKLLEFNKVSSHPDYKYKKTLITYNLFLKCPEITYTIELDENLDLIQAGILRKLLGRFQFITPNSVGMDLNIEVTKEKIVTEVRKVVESRFDFLILEKLVFHDNEKTFRFNEKLILFSEVRVEKKSVLVFEKDGFEILVGERKIYSGWDSLLSYEDQIIECIHFINPTKRLEYDEIELFFSKIWSNICSSYGE